jgi:carbon-monoxide dehydrogenase small subunit
VSRHVINVEVNGEARRIDVESRTLLVHVIREQLGLTGTHVGCDTTSCGACTVLVDGTPVKACAMFGVQADGKQVQTIEGISPGEGKLSPVQQAFHEKHGLQCGFCTAGLIITATALLAHNSQPTRDEIRTAISGNICRCTGYENVVLAIESASRVSRGG